MPPPARRARAAASLLPAYSEHSIGSPEVSAMSSDSDQSGRRRAKKSGRKDRGGGTKSRAAAVYASLDCTQLLLCCCCCCRRRTPTSRTGPLPSKPTTGFLHSSHSATCCAASHPALPLPNPTPARSAARSLQQTASMRRAPSRPAVGAGVSGGGMARAPSGIGRSRSTRGNGGYGGGADPNDYVGRRVWRLWPSENPPWVEGFVQGWDPGEAAGQGECNTGRAGVARHGCSGSEGGSCIDAAQGCHKDNHCVLPASSLPSPPCFRAPHPPPPACRYGHVHGGVRPQHARVHGGAVCLQPVHRGGCSRAGQEKGKPCCWVVGQLAPAVCTNRPPRQVAAG